MICFWRKDGLVGLSVGDVIWDCWKCDGLLNVKIFLRVVWGEMWGDIEGGEKGGDISFDNLVCVELRGDVNDDDVGDVLLLIIVD